MDTAELRIVDLGLAAYLTLQGYESRRLEGRPGRRVFVFAPEAGDACQRYFAGASVTAQEFSDALRAIKTQLLVAR